ncbi:MAG: IS30 family transposase [Parvibaculaceae bacterium]
MSPRSAPRASSSRHAAVITRLLRRWLKPLPGGLRRTLTQDNGTEFVHYRLHKPLAIKTFFYDPHSPWQKGGIENMNGRLRRSLPRRTDLATLSHHQIRAIARRNNSIPRKCLGFKTAFEVFNAFS